MAQSSQLLWQPTPERARASPRVRQNLAENLLRWDDDRPALIFQGESGPRREVGYTELRRLVARAARGLRELGVEPGDRVYGWLPNLPQTLVAILATTSLGGAGVDRFGQIAPRILFSAEGSRYGGRSLDRLAGAAAVTSVANPEALDWFRNRHELGEGRNREAPLAGSRNA